MRILFGILCALAVAMVPVTNAIAIPTSASDQQIANKTAKTVDVSETTVATVVREYRLVGVVSIQVQSPAESSIEPYGVLENGSTDKIDDSTLFRVGSISKSFTGLLAAQLSLSGKLLLDEPVIRFLPELADDSRFHQLNLRDFLSHRTGLDLGALDLLLWPQPNGYTSHDVLTAMKSVKQIAPIRTQFNYTNAAYVIAGEIIARVTGKTYAEAVNEMIFVPLGMTQCTFGAYHAIGESRAKPGKHMSNIASPHLRINGRLQVIRPDRGYVDVGVEAAAGGARCSAHAMRNWLQFLSNPNQFSHLSSLAEALRLATTVQMINTPINAYSSPVGEIEAYGLGFEIRSRGGVMAISHSGGVAGMLSHYVVWVATAKNTSPKHGRKQEHRNSGYALMINESSAPARRALQHVIEAQMQPQYANDVSARANLAAVATATTAVTEDNIAPVMTSVPAHTSRALIGRYVANWLGDVSICGDVTSARLTMRINRSVRMTADLQQRPPHDVAVLWHDAAVGSDSVLTITEKNADQVLQFKLAPLNPKMGSDFDFSYIQFSRVANDCK